MAHRREAPRTHYGEATIIRNDLVKGPFHPVDLLLHNLDDLLDNLERLGCLEVLFNLHINHHDSDPSMLVPKSILLEL